MKFPKFLVGFLFGAVVGLIVWYWQKSTSAEEGALAVLDRLAAAELRVRDLEARLRIAQEKNQESEPREVLSGLQDLWGLEQRKVEAKGSRPLDKTEASKSNEAIKDNLKLINGIGPAYEKRLNEAGVLTFKDLTTKTVDELRDITNIQSWQATDPQQWIDDAKSRIQD